MRKVTICLLVGLFIFMLGVYLSTFLTTQWIIIGTSLAVFGGMVIGGSSYFLPNPKK